MNFDQQDEGFVPIGVVERETGLTRDALRKWELRYGFPVPERDERGERIYSLIQVERLRLVKRLIDRGHRPSKLLVLELDGLRLLADVCPEGEGASDVSDSLAAEVFRALGDHDPEALRRVLARDLMRVGLDEFVQVRVAKLNEIIGDAWGDGRIVVFQEHLYTETVQILLQEAITCLGANPAAPRLLLATPPGELHSIGIIMAQARLALAGAYCISLGSQVPMSELVAAAAAYKVDVVGLSFSVAYPVRRIAPQLKALRRQLDPAIQLWAGGQGMARARGVEEDARVFLSLEDVGAALHSLRPRQAWA